MKCNLEKTQVVYHQESDMICVASPAEAGMVLHPVPESSLNAMVAWICRDRIWEPWLYKILMKGWRTFKKFILRRPVSQGKYERVILGHGDGFVVLTCEHFATEPIRIPFLKRPTSA